MELRPVVGAALVNEHVVKVGRGEGAAPRALPRLLVGTSARRVRARADGHGSWSFEQVEFPGAVCCGVY